MRNAALVYQGAQGGVERDALVQIEEHTLTHTPPLVNQLLKLQCVK